MDFDCLAAQYAVTKLVPNVRMLPGYPLVGSIREFLALYRDTLPISQLKYIDWQHVDHLYLVDCQHAERLDDKVRKLLNDPQHPRTYTIFDHHPIDPAGLGPGARSDSIIRPVGSATTILVEQIKQRRVKLTSFDATLLLLGIYEDTGCLTYGGTTATDAECVAFLLKAGADLARVNDYMHPKLSDEQVRLLEQLVAHSTPVVISGAKVVIACGELPRYLDGLATLTRKLLEVESADAAVSVVRMRDRVHLVGRSDSPEIDIRLLVREFGGDGHPGAGSAVTREGGVEEIAARVKSLLRSSVKPEKQAFEIMTSPVRTIRPRTTMDEAGRLLLRYDLDGLVVTEGDEVVGVVSRRDIDQARHHKLSHAPVQGFMSKPVIMISPESPLSEIQRTMVKEDIGRLPVIDESGQLVGIVTRRELMNTLYGQPGDRAGKEEQPTPEVKRTQIRQLTTGFDQPTQWLFEQIGVVAAQLNMVAYSVGGCVRDLILARPNFDLDFVVEGSAIELSQALEQAFPARLRVVARHERFQTATAEFYADTRREVDLSTARVEFYEFPAALPTVEASSLQQDLFRRDFTINALAICLNPGRFGELVDYFGGLSDLEDGIIRILHPFSFIEDPTRIIRAARFAARLGFQLCPRTREQAERAVGMGIFDDLGGFRMRSELKLILESPHRMKALELLGQLGGRLRYLDSQLEWGGRQRLLLRRAERLFARYAVEEQWVVYLALLLSQLEPIRRAAVVERLHLANDQRGHIDRGLRLPGQLRELSGEPSRSQVYAMLHGHSDQALAIAACLAKPGSSWRRLIKLYLEELKYVDVLISGADLINMGFSEGPEIGRMLNKLSEAKLDGKIDSREEELLFVQSNFAVQGNIDTVGEF
jgi:tRNA nucleotidyltransferase (CCA-adding enzyme)